MTLARLTFWSNYSQSKVTNSSKAQENTDWLISCWRYVIVLDRINSGKL